MKNKLKCPVCGSELHLHLAFDGLDCESEAGENSGYDWYLALLCNQMGCGRIYPVARVKDFTAVSEMVERMRPYAGCLNDV